MWALSRPNGWHGNALEFRQLGRLIEYIFANLTHKACLI